MAKHGGEQLLRDAQHLIDEAGVEVHVGADTLVHPALAADDLGSQPLHGGVELILGLHVLFCRQLVDKGLEDLGAGIGFGVNGMADAVDESGVVKGIPVEELFQIGAHLVIVLPVAHLPLDLVKHMHHLDVGAAVLGPLQAAQRRRNGGVGVGAGGGDDMGGKGGVVAAAVLCVEHQCHVQHPGFRSR